MAPLPVIADVFRVALDWVYDDRLDLAATNVMHFRASSGTPADQLTAIDAHVAAGMWTCGASHAHVTRLTCTPLDGSGASATLNTGNPAKWSGSHTSQSIMPQVAAIAKLTTAKRGRSYRGRVFIPWVAEDGYGEGKIASADKATMQTAWVAFFNAMVTASVYPVVASYKLATSEDVTTILIETYGATQRRRNARTAL